MGPLRTSKRKLERAELINEAMRMRLDGHQLSEISAALGYKSPSSAHDLIREGIRDLLEENAEQVFALEVQRLDKMQRAAATAVENGDTKAMDIWLKLHDRRVKLFQLDRLNNNDTSADARALFESFVDAVRGTPTPQEDATT